jgi:hypothetical protein
VFKNTVVFVAVADGDEAHYLASLLNSSWANYLLRASGVRGGKSAFATNVLKSLSIPRFTRRSMIARELAGLGKRAQVETVAGDADALHVTEIMIDEAAARFWEIGDRQRGAMLASLDALDPP